MNDFFFFWLTILLDRQVCLKKERYCWVNWDVTSRPCRSTSTSSIAFRLPSITVTRAINRSLHPLKRSIHCLIDKFGFFFFNFWIWRQIWNFWFWRQIWNFWMFEFGAKFGIFNFLNLAPNFEILNFWIDFWLKYRLN